MRFDDGWVAGLVQCDILGLLTVAGTSYGQTHAGDIPKRRFVSASLGLGCRTTWLLVWSLHLLRLPMATLPPGMELVSSSPRGQYGSIYHVELSPNVHLGSVVLRNTVFKTFG